MERKATDILLDVEAKIDSISKEIKLLSFNYKILLDKINVITSNSNVVSKNSSNVLSTHEKKLNSVTEKEKQPQKQGKYKETIVSQKILYPDGSICVLAKVIILDEDGQEIKKTTVAADGQWRVTLAPGQYKVHILKAALKDNKKPKIDRTSEFLITGESPLLELPPSKE